MQITVEHRSATEREMNIIIPATTIEKQVNHKLSEIKSKIRLPGFRPGKVPANLVARKFSKDVLLEVSNKLINDSYQEAIEEKKLKPAADPVIDIKVLERGKDLEYTVTLDVFPSLDKLSLAGVKIEQPIIEISADDVDSTLEKIREGRSIWVEKDKKAETGDKVTAQATHIYEGEREESADEPLQLTLGNATMPAEITEKLSGCKVGDTVLVNLSAETGNEAAVDPMQPIQMRLQIEKVEVRQLPDVDKAFIAEMGVADGELETLRTEIAKNLTAEKDQRIQKLMEHSVIAQLIAKVDVPLPEKMVESKVKELGAMYWGEDWEKKIAAESATSDQEEKIGKVQAMLNKIARKNVAQNILMREVILQNHIELDYPRVRERIAKMSESYVNPEEMIRGYNADKEKMQQLEAEILGEQVVETLLAEADVVETPIQLSELIELEKKVTKDPETEENEAENNADPS